MRLVGRYTQRLLFLIALLLGLQLPGVVDQYQQRLQARQLEAEQQLDSFRAIAERYFDGDLEALVIYHQRSSDPVFRAEAEVLRRQLRRVETLTRHLRALDTALPQRMLQVATAADSEVLRQTLLAHRPSLPLTPEAIVSGVTLGLVSALSIRLLWLPVAIWRRRRHRIVPLVSDKQINRVR